MRGVPISIAVHGFYAGLLRWPGIHHCQIGPARRWPRISQRGEVRRCDVENQREDVLAIDKYDDDHYMAMAVEQAREAYVAGEVPVGAILVDQSSGQVIARARNRTEEDCDPTSHAEMACIRHASKVLGRWRLLDCALYVTLEPCPMCAGAILQSRLGTVVYGAPNKLLGADGSWIQMLRGRQSPALSLDEDGCQSKGANCCTTLHAKGEFTQPQAYQQTTAREISRSNLDSNPSSETVPIVAADTKSHPFHPNIDVRRGVLGEECAHLMRMFFKQRRLSSNADV